MNTLPRLDVLLYAHDGRGLGHASRTIAIGIALRRLAPELRVLFLSGCSFSQELIGAAPLDWIKLSSYETEVSGGKSRGTMGKSNFSDDELGRLRSSQIRLLFETLRPRVVLADHSPQGKHRELLGALQSDGSPDTTWVLGIRGVVGRVNQVGSQLARQVFASHYKSLLWYGDSRILGHQQLRELEEHFGQVPLECGYVSGIRERSAASAQPRHGELAGVVSVPWIGEKTPAFLTALYGALESMGESTGKWVLFLDGSHRLSQDFYRQFAKLPWCRIEEPGQRYIEALQRCRCAVIFGGYNSLMDVISLSLPTLVILRDMQEGEQQLHLERLSAALGDMLSTTTEECGKHELRAALSGLQKRKITTPPPPVNVNGAKTAARHLITLLRHNEQNRAK